MEFFADRIEYDFLDGPRRDRIRMVMYFRDMVAPRLDRRRPALEFRLRRRLDMFASAYDPGDATQALRIEFDSAADVRVYEREVMARVLGEAAPG